MILISVGYGRDPSGQLAMSFGPLNHEGGERRLNVLITRARARLEVFASITADDIDLERARGRGVAVLKTFLAYAADRRARDRASDRARLRLRRSRRRSRARSPAAGHQVDSQVGVAGCFVDLAIRDPARPGRYLLGIECDGAAYHSALWARDRDRLRQQVLEDQGWILHRVWSADWLRDPAGELRRIAAALEDARARWAARDESLGGGGRVRRGRMTPATSRWCARPVGGAGGRRGPAPRPTSRRRSSSPPTASRTACRPRRWPMRWCRIVAIEGPVHGDEVARRIARLAGLERTGRRIAEAVGRGLARAVREQRLVRDGPLLRAARRRARGPRPLAVRSASLRRPDMLPPAEIQAAILAGHRRATTARPAARSRSRSAGCSASRRPARGCAALIEAEAEGLLASGRLDRQGTSLVLAGQREPLPAAPDAFSPARPSAARGSREAIAAGHASRSRAAGGGRSPGARHPLPSTMAGVGSGLNATTLGTIGPGRPAAGWSRRWPAGCRRSQVWPPSATAGQQPGSPKVRIAVPGGSGGPGARPAPSGVRGSCAACASARGA